MKRFIKNNKNILLFGLVIFLFVYIFYTNVHPLVIFDADDWTYISEPRSFIPLWGIWNPAKLFPETLMPLCGSIAAYLIYPFTNDYIGSFTIITAFLGAIIISIYICMFTKYIKKRFELNDFISISIGILFFLIHFLIFVVGTNNNQYMFLTHNVNCFYNYLIPNLLCFILIFYLLINDIDYSINFPKNIKYGMLLFCIYIAIFSNLYCNIVLGVYSGSLIFYRFIKKKKGISITKFFKDNFLLFLIIILWIVALVFELSGGRAELQHKGDYFLLVKDCLYYLKEMILHGMNRNLLISFIIVFLAFLITIVRNKDKKENLDVYITITISLIVITIYMILVSAKVGPEYILRVEDTFGIYAFGIIFIIICLTYLFKTYPKLVIVLPILVVFFLVEFNSNYKTFKETNSSNINPNICKQVGEDVINQIIEADKNGDNNLELHVPYANTGDNWPHSTYIGKRISKTLYKHNLINRIIDITVVPDNEMNVKYNLQKYSKLYNNLTE